MKNININYVKNENNNSMIIQKFTDNKISCAELYWLLDEIHKLKEKHNLLASPFNIEPGCPFKSGEKLGWRNKSLQKYVQQYKKHRNECTKNNFKCGVCKKRSKNEHK